MAQPVLMPRLGQSMEEGTIVRWFKQEGDTVAAGEPLVEIMTDKANHEFESPAAGVLRRILAAADATVEVNALIAIIGDPEEALTLEEAPPTRVPPGAQEAAVLPTTEVTTPPPHPNPVEGARIAISPRARRLADARGVPVAALASAGSGPGGRVLERDVNAYLEQLSAAGTIAAQSAADPSAKARITPLAARIADDLGLGIGEIGDLAQGLPGSRIRAEDVRRLADKSRSQAPAARADDSPAVAEIIPFRGIRKAVAENVSRSRFGAPHVTLTLEADMTEASAVVAQLRPEIEKAYGVKLTVTDLVVKAAAAALDGHPLCNAALVGEEIRVYSDRNIGVAVATDTGLIVPVVRNADSKRLGEVSSELKALIERCRAGRQTAADLSGGTFSITNLGAFGIDTFDPIIVPPQSCILGVGRLADKAVVKNGQVVVRPMMNLCLSFDHRVVDGAPAARFLQRLQRLLESPMLIFV